MTLQLIGGLAGGIGLFILGMQLMTDGLKLAAGQTLRNILAKSTSTTLRGLMAGAFITSLVQSSSAVTVATIGFVNAGLMSLGKAVTIIYGSNVGTTMTGWLVALVGFHVNIKAFALPAIGIGMLLRVFFSTRKAAPLGQALAGFGLFFIGIDQLKTTFGGLGESIQFSALAGNDPMSLLLFVGIGMLLTFSMQSSSAAMAIILTANAGGFVPLEAAAATVIGANLGTTSTAALASIGATANAKRTAAAHVVFNVGTSFVAFLILPLVFGPLVASATLSGIATGPSEILALFHTIFNILGVLLFLPLTGLLVDFLEKRFRSAEEDEARPRHLDKTLLATPVLAINAMAMELARVGAIARMMAQSAISSETSPGPRLAADKKVLDSLVESVAEFSTTIQRSNLPKDLDELLPNALRVSGHYTVMAELAKTVAAEQNSLPPMTNPELADAIAQFKGAVTHFLEEADTQAEQYSAAACTEQIDLLTADYNLLKSKVLREGQRMALPARQLVTHLEILSQLRQIAERAEKGARYLSSLTLPASDQPPDLSPVET